MFIQLCFKMNKNGKISGQYRKIHFMDRVVPIEEKIEIQAETVLTENVLGRNAYVNTGYLDYIGIDLKDRLAAIFDIKINISSIDKRIIELFYCEKY